MEDQYRDASNLNARIVLHERFGMDEYPWQRWVFDQLEPGTRRILELGCGPGGLWTENLDGIPEEWTITLTDASSGMLREAEHNLSSDRRFDFRVADAREIPFGEQAFDAVIANHVLHHLPDTTPAFAETTRVLKPGGMFYAATNGRDHLRELGWMLRVLDPAHPADSPTRHPLTFSLENGAEQLSRWFPEVSLRHREDELAVTEVKPLLDYVLSTMSAQAAANRLPASTFRERVSELDASLKRELHLNSEIRLTRESGLFVAHL